MSLDCPHNCFGLSFSVGLHYQTRLSAGETEPALRKSAPQSWISPSAIRVKFCLSHSFSTSLYAIPCTRQAFVIAYPSFCARCFHTRCVTEYVAIGRPCATTCADRCQCGVSTSRRHRVASFDLVAPGSLRSDALGPSVLAGSPAIDFPGRVHWGGGGGGKGIP